METLQIEKANALAAYNQADAAGKKMLTALLGENTFGKITDRIKTFEDARQMLGVMDKGWEPEIVAAPGDAYPIQALAKLVIIIRALNEGWEPDWSNSSQYKYVVYMKNTGSGLSFIGVGRWPSGTYCGSRLCFKNRELAEYAGKQFENLYKSFFTL